MLYLIRYWFVALLIVCVCVCVCVLRLEQGTGCGELGVRRKCSMWFRMLSTGMTATGSGKLTDDSRVWHV